MEGDGAGMGGATVFPEIDSLPGAEGKAASVDGKGEVDGGKGGADMGGHVVIALGGVNEKWVAVGNEAGEEGFQIAPDIGVGIFLNEERGGGVAEVESDEAGLKAVFGEPGGDLVGEVVEAAAAGGDGQLV